MTVGLNTVNMANKLLDALSNTNPALGAQLYVELHTGDPGASGTSNLSSVTTRKTLTWSAAASGSKAITATLPSWPSWAGSSETISHMAVWDALTTGNFLYSFALTTPKAMTPGDTLNLTSHSVSLTPLAA